MAAVRHVELVIEAPENGQRGHERVLLEDAEHLFVQFIFGNAVVMVKPSLRRPANIKGRGDMRPRPVENLRNFIPVVHLFVFQMFHRRPCDNHSIKLFILHQLKVPVKGFHVFNGGILVCVAFHLHESDFNLQRRIGKQANQVCFSRDFQRHQVQNDNAQRTDVLRGSPRIVYDEDVFLFQQLNGGKFIW